jgi:hypothetical protein
MQGIGRVAGCILVVCVAAAMPSMSGCAPSFGNPPPILEPNITKFSIHDQAWIDRLGFWLAVGYTEIDDQASFASISVDLARTPSIYATYGALRILQALGEAPSEPAQIAAWIDSLRRSDGAYDDAQLDLPLLVETYWAIESLRMLDAPADGTGDTIRFVLSLQQTSGAFAPGGDIGGPPQEQELVATHYALELLLDLCPSHCSDALNKGSLFLREYLLSQPPADALDFTSPEITYQVGAARSLARLDPGSVPPQVLLLLEQSAPHLADLPGNPDTYALADLLLDAAEYLGLEDSMSIATAARTLAARSLVQDIRTQAASGATPPFDPMVMGNMVKLAARLVLAIPEREALLNGIGRYRISKGWTSFILPFTDPSSTCYALALSQALGRQTYNAQKVAAYARRILQSSMQVPNPAEALAALNMLKLLRQEPEQGSLATLREAMFAELSRSNSETTLVDPTSFLELAYALRWEIPAEIRNKLRQTLQGEMPSEGSPPIQTLYGLALLNALAGRAGPDTHWIAQQVMALSTAGGGFLSSPQAPLPDLHATSLALKTLAILDQQGMLDLDALHAFVLSCKDDFGFNYLPLELIRENPEAYGNVQPDLRITHEALKLLAFLENGF